MKKNLLGQKFGLLIVKEEHSERRNKRVQWICECECGNVRNVITNHLTSGSVTSCGCEYKENLVDQKFGYLLVQKKSEHTNKYQAIYWECLCSCGNTTKVSTGHLKSGSVKSCGCKPNLMRHAIKGKETPEYQSWLSLKNRCYNTSSRDYKNYGGRGIIVCDRWLDSYANFYEDMGERPSNDFSIERLDVNGNYDPSNCIWADRTTQVRNRRMNKTNKSGVVGVLWKKDRNKWHAFIGVNYQKINLGYYDSLEDAIKARKEGELKYWEN